MDQADDLLHRQLALCMLPGIGSVLARNLVSYCGGVDRVFEKSRRMLEKVPGIGPERAAVILDKSILIRAEEELAYIRKNRIKSVFYLDENYPQRLKHCDDAPVMLFFKGVAELNPVRSIAIVGTRNMTSYGKELTEKLVEELVPYGVSIISGLAYGVDVVAHKAALKYKVPTIGITAHGLDRMYPFMHKPVAEEMLQHGGILTEYPSQTIPGRDNFPARNRIIAGMTDATVVVESANRGGALITAEFANQYNRDVFAFPGRVYDKFSKGCHQLIRENKAMIVEDAEQIAFAMNWEAKGKDSKKAARQLDLFADKTPEELQLLKILNEKGPLSLDSLSILTEIPVSSVSALLLQLEFQGVLKASPGKMFELLI